MSLLKALGIDKYTRRFKQWIASKYVAKDNLKTINGESLEGEGDIKISGGSSSVNADWNQKDNTKPDYIKNRTHYLDIIGGETLKDISIASDIYADSKLKSHNIEVIDKYGDGYFMKLVYEQGIEVFVENLYIGEELIKAVQGKPIYYNDIAIYQFDFSFDSDTGIETYTSTIWVDVDAAVDRLEDDEVLEYAKEKAKESIIVYDADALTNKYFIKKMLDEKFIPDTIARKSDLENIGGGTSATPNWNAKEGDAGYIKNKPFNLETKEIDFELDGGRAVAYVSDIFDYDGLYILDKLIQFNGNYNFTIDCYEGFESYRGIIIECNGNDIYITPNYTDEYDPIENMVDYCNEVIKIFKIKVIDSFFIPNTVLKTTPQTLSDADKKQVLTNLGLNDLPNGFTSKFQLYQDNGGLFFSNENLYNIFDALRNESAHYYMDLSINNVLDIGISYSFSDLGISYSDLLGIIYYSKNVIISFGKDFITLTCPSEGNDRSLSFESDAGYNMTINIVEQTLILNQN